MTELQSIAPSERFQGDIGWLKSFHIFNFAENFLPGRSGFGDLLVVNEDYIEPDSGFGMHPHRDMEIVTWVLAGSLTHEDNAGNKGVIVPGEIQRMSAGSGVIHSEFNHSSTEKVHLLQMWLLPDVNAIPPRYDQISVKDLISNELGCIASGQVDAPIHLHNKNASLHVGRYDLASKIELPNNKKLFIYDARGALEVEGTNYAQGSSLLISDPMTDTSAKCSDNSEIVIWSVDSKARAMSRYGD